MDDENKKILYVQTHGVDMPERSATPFYLAAAGAAMDAEVGIYFTMNGPTLLQRGVPDKLIVPKKGGGGRELMYFIKQAMDIGVKLYVCQPSLDLHALKLEDLIDGVEMIGGAAFNELALNADAVIAF
ncbi:MAG: DsrE family protein [Chloroflexi bacterium]|nr:DsrE family protein [Chloroflexota bacterium]